MGENMRPLGSTPPPLPPPPSTSSSGLLYPQVFPSNNPSMTNDAQHQSHQYGTFGSGFGAAMACSSSGYPTFFPSKTQLLFISSRNCNHFLFLSSASTRGYDGLSPFSTPYNRSCPTYPSGIQTNLSPGKKERNARI